ncbi:MAG: hypothetical protein RSC24_16195 [Clostridium sp.]
MILAIEIIILSIGILVYFLQNKFRSEKKTIRGKLVYWTVLLFISITYNSLLFSAYPDSYDIEIYLNSTVLINVGILVGVFLLIQIFAPSKYIKLIKSFFMNKEEREKTKEDRAAQDKKNRKIREEHFEVFLETSCWFGFLFTIILEGYASGFSGVFVSDFLGISLINTVCVIMFISIPVILRQVIYYLMRIRDEKEDDSITSLEKDLHNKLKRENIRL